MKINKEIFNEYKKNINYAKNELKNNDYNFFIIIILIIMFIPLYIIVRIILDDMNININISNESVFRIYSAYLLFMFMSYSIIKKNFNHYSFYYSLKIFMKIENVNINAIILFLCKKTKIIKNLFPNSTITDENVEKFHHLILNHIGMKKYLSEDFIKYINNAYDNKLLISNARIEKEYYENFIMPQKIENFNNNIEVFNKIKLEHYDVFDKIKNSEILFNQINNLLKINNLNKVDEINNKINDFLKSGEIEAIVEYKILEKLYLLIKNKMNKEDVESLFLFQNEIYEFKENPKIIEDKIKKYAFNLNEKYN